MHPERSCVGTPTIGMNIHFVDHALLSAVGGLEWFEIDQRWCQKTTPKSVISRWRMHVGTNHELRNL